MALDGNDLGATGTRQSLSLAFLAYIESTGELTANARRRAEGALHSGSERIETILMELGLIGERALLDALSSFLGCAIAEQPDASRDFLDASGLDLAYLKRNALLPLAEAEGVLHIATCFPLDNQAARCLAYLRSAALRLSICSQQSLLAAFERLQAEESEQGAGLSDAGKLSELLDLDAERLRDLASEAPVIRLLNRLVATAVDRHASDIHIEPLKDQLQVRYRIDGVLQTAETIAKTQQAGLVSRIKVLARLNIAEQRLPQDGKIRFVVKGREIDFRVSTMPSIEGEAIVLRILARLDVELSLTALGFDQAAAGLLKSFIGEPNGIVLVTGPTGSGKTTTLYALLKLLNSGQGKIFTVEDPVEYQIPGITQVHVRPNIGLDFAAVLRSVLRQDPDIIMVGEIRDGETARIAVQAALTGHLVLSTLHTNSAAASITRLRDLGIEDYLIASTLRGVASQRLIRTLCTACQHPSSEGDSGAEVTDTSCRQCSGVGFQGRTVIGEILAVSDPLRKAIARSGSEAEFEEIAAGNGFISLNAAAHALVHAGKTTLGEVARTLGARGL